MRRVVCFPSRPLRSPVPSIYAGVYFKDALLEPALADPKMKPFLNEERIREFWDFGGIRIEDDVLVTETGHESLTDVPKEIADIEALMVLGERGEDGLRVCARRGSA